jgi:8-oxo-dGTP pyrophosphatase MutT (NUDIX family)
VEETLKREFIEETGIVLKGYTFIGHNEYFCDYLNESDEPRELHHLGLYYKVSASFDKIKADADGQDYLGAEFIDIKDLDKIQISPIARPMIEKVINKD